MIHLQKMIYDGDGEKTRNTKTNAKTKERVPSFVALPSPPIYQMETDCFPVPEKHRKQTGPTLSGRGFLI